MTSLTRNLLSGSAWALGGKVVTTICGLLVTALLARLLAPEAMGAYFLTLSLVSISAIVAQLGLGQAVVRLIAESLGTDRPERARKAAITTVGLGLAGIAFVGGVLGLGAGAWLTERVFGSAEMVGVMGLAPLWLAVIAAPTLLAEIFRGHHDIRLATVFSGALTSLLSALLFGALWLAQGHSNLSEVVTLSITAGFTNTLVAGLLMWRRLAPFGEAAGKGSDSRIAALEIWVIAWPLWLTGLLLFALTQADLWILGIYRTPNELAAYGAAARLVKAIGTPLFVANAVLPPVIAEMYAQGRKQELQQVLRATATVAGIPTVAVLIVFVVFGAPILGLVYGDFYRTGATVLVLLSLGHLVNAAAGPCGLVLMLTGHQMAMFRISLLSGVLALLGMLWAAPRYGPVGIAAAAATGMTLQNLLMLVTAHRRMQIWTHVDLRHLLAIPVVFRALRRSK
ncbi:MAG: oligosaccharide flippase family protein [Gemmatimonadetes bacterium]|nr:oligosaccharide flippase family protein [Gemmatimonadota bacterium]